MNPFHEFTRNITRRHFFSAGSHALGWVALTSLLGGKSVHAAAGPALGDHPLPHFAPKAKHVIYLHMVGGPPQMDLYDYKPVMKEWYDKDLPESVRMGQRLTTMTSGQARFPIAPSKFKFARHGKSGMYVSELLPHTAKPSNQEQVQAISARLWSSGYLSGEHAGVSFRTSGDPILYLNNPPGVPTDVRRKTLDGLKALNEMNYRAAGDPETHTRISQYE